MDSYTVEQLAARWQVDDKIIYRLVKRGRLPHFRVGRHIRFTPQAVAEYEAGQSVQRPLTGPLPHAEEKGPNPSLPRKPGRRKLQPWLLVNPVD